MGNEVAVSEGREICGYSHDQVGAIKRALNFNMSDEDLHIFLHICRHTKLDPLARQIYAIPRGGKMTIQTSIDGFRLIADRSGRYAPGRPTEFTWDDKGNLVAATAYVKKLSGGEWHEIGETAVLREYAGATPFWKKMPCVMLSKVAEARALRRAFPADLSGLYSAEEMDQAPTDVTLETAAAPVEKSISEDQWKAMDEYLNGHDELRSKLKQLCKVDDLRNITEAQYKAAGNYAKAYIEKQNAALQSNEES